jgi:ribonuclease G
MSKELIISSNRHETRVAVLEDDQVVEIFHQRENEYSLAGSIHKGKVTRVLPGMQSAFVDIGLERDAFLYVSDFFEDNEEYDKIVTSVEDKVFKQSSPAAAPVPAAGAEAAPEAAARENAGAETAAAHEATATAAPLPQERREERGGRGPSDRGDRDDRRGDRGGRRRGRGGRGGRGGGRSLPDSKFYSPRGGDSGSRPYRSEDPVPERTESVGLAESPAPSNDDDFLVLPGEKLSKYRHGAGPEHAEDAETSSFSETDEHYAAEPEDRAVETHAAIVETEPALGHSIVIESAAAPELEDELAEAVEEAAEDVLAEEEEEAEVAEAIAEETVPELALEEADPETESEDSVAVETELFSLEAAGEAEPATEALESPDAEGQPNVEEGPEPARIPTSLTATLREQGGRYPHRVSRRSRRRGRGGQDRGEGRGPAPEFGQRGPQQETRQVEGRAERPERSERGERPERGERGERPERAERPERSAGQSPSITDLLKEGQEIIVQIAKEPIGQKGARITSHIALPGRFLVYMPTVDHVGVSRKIPSDDERLRLKRILQTHRAGVPGGYIVRTAGEGRTEEELRADMMFLYNLWLDMRQKAERRPAPLLIHHDLNVVERILRDQLTSSFKNIWVDNEELYEAVLSFVQRFQPALVSRVKMYTRSNPIFDEFGVTAELEKALRPKVWLKSGGYIVINQTEALVAIDINTGKFVGKSNRLEDTIVRTNTDAIKEIVRQVRLRDLGGIIVVDFIDMDERKNRQKVMQALEEAMRADRAPYKILQFNDFGLVAITRKRVKQSLERTLCTPCPYCEGAGYVKSAQTIVGEILTEAHKIAKAVEGDNVLLRVNPDVAKLLKSNQNTYLQELEEVLGRTVLVKGDPQLHQEKFDLA